MTVLDFKKRSVGEILAPRADSELVEKLATDRERARCAAIVRAMASRQHGAYQGLLLTALNRIEKGEEPV